MVYPVRKNGVSPRSGGETCSVLSSISKLVYFKEFFTAIMQGRSDYENLLTMTIGIIKKMI